MSNRATRLSLAEIYEECKVALRDRETVLEEGLAFLYRIGLGHESEAAIHVRSLLAKTRNAMTEVGWLNIAAATELEQLRYERNRLADLVTAPTQEAQADG